MTELVELSSNTHGGLRVVENCSLDVAAKQHVVNLRVAEIGKAVSGLPVFMTKNPQSGGWALSAICSFEPGQNLFVENARWTATYLPTSMQTYPLFLMRSPNDEKSYTVGIDEQSQAFSSKSGEALFDKQGKASLYLSKTTALLEADIKNDIQTFQFLSRLDELGLMKSIDVQVHYADDSVNTIRGLHTVDEDSLQSLAPEQLEELNKNGYLLSIHAMLISTFQLNSLIAKHNQKGLGTVVRQVKLESSKDVTAT
ncbi:MAG: SapC family protein [Halioglobus sp.]